MQANIDICIHIYIQTLRAKISVLGFRTKLGKIPRVRFSIYFKRKMFAVRNGILLRGGRRIKKKKKKEKEKRKKKKEERISEREEESGRIKMFFSAFARNPIKPV